MLLMTEAFYFSLAGVIHVELIPFANNLLTIQQNCYVSVQSPHVLCIVELLAGISFHHHHRRVTNTTEIEALMSHKKAHGSLLRGCAKKPHHHVVKVN